MIGRRPMVRPSMLTACGHHCDFGRRCKSARGSVISSHEAEPLKKESELIQAMALKVQNCYGNERDTDQHCQFHSSFCEISRSYLLASQVHLHLRIIVRCKSEYDTRKTPAPGPAFYEISISFCGFREF